MQCNHEFTTVVIVLAATTFHHCLTIVTLVLRFIASLWIEHHILRVVTPRRVMLSILISIIIIILDLLWL